MNPENTRVTAVREHYGLSKAEFARRVGLDASTVNKAESGPTKPGLETLAIILRAYPSVNAAWLAFGQGDMFVTEPPALPADIESVQRQARLARAEVDRLKMELAAKVTYIQHLEQELEKYEGGSEQPEDYTTPSHPRRPTGTRAYLRSQQRAEAVAPVQLRPRRPTCWTEVR